MFKLYFNVNDMRLQALSPKAVYHLVLTTIAGLILFGVLSTLGPMHLAVEANSPKAVLILSKIGFVDEKIGSFEGMECTTPLYMAAQHGYTQIVDILLDNGADLHFAGCHPLFGNNVLQASMFSLEPWMGTLLPRQNRADLVAHLMVDRGIDPISLETGRDSQIDAALKGDTKALDTLKSHAEDGYQYQQLELAEMYEKGLGVKADPSEAKKWRDAYADKTEIDELIRRATAGDESALPALTEKADRGDKFAQGALGEAYCAGEAGVQANTVLAEMWLEKAAAQGYGPAITMLGSRALPLPPPLPRITLEKIVKKPPLPKRFQILRAKAEAWNTDAAFELGRAYESGKEIPRDFDEAKNWFRRAASKGNAYAAFHLGELYKSGSLGKTDYEEAYYWMRYAAKYGIGNDPLVLSETDEVRRHLSSEQIKTGEYNAAHLQPIYPASDEVITKDGAVMGHVMTFPPPEKQGASPAPTGAH